MRRRTYAISLVAVAILLVLLVALFVPLFGVEATPPDFQPYSTITTTHGNQTQMFTLVATPPNLWLDCVPVVLPMGERSLAPKWAILPIHRFTSDRRRSILSDSATLRMARQSS